MNRPITILMADDNADDRLLTERALRRVRVTNELRFVGDGVELLDVLKRRGDHADAPRPDLVLLDLKMPRMSGRDALHAMKSDPALADIPVVVMTTSQTDRDVLDSYDLGAASYLTKPVTFESLVEVLRVLDRFDVVIVTRPRGGRAGAPAPD